MIENEEQVLMAEVDRADQALTTARQMLERNGLDPIRHPIARMRERQLDEAVEQLAAYHMVVPTIVRTEHWGK